jgi:hypothetical protein
VGIIGFNPDAFFFQSAASPAASLISARFRAPDFSHTQ